MEESSSNFLKPEDFDNHNQSGGSGDVAIELLMNRMEDGFGKIYCQLEDLNERISEIQGISDKVDMLEASVRLLENHLLWPAELNFNDSSSSSAVGDSVTPTPTFMMGQRSLKRNHTIGNIKYDSSAYKVSFKMDLDTEEEENSELKLSEQFAEQENYLVPTNIVRSKSFSSNDYNKNQSSQNVSDTAVGVPRGRPPHQLQLPTARSHSLKQPNKTVKNTRFSWTMQDVPDLKDSKFRGSMTSLASMDLGSGSVTPTPIAIINEISAKDLVLKPSVIHFGNLELKKTSGFKSYKRYWAVLDSHLLYIYGREKDSKAKQVLDVSHCIVTESANNDSSSIEIKPKDHHPERHSSGSIRDSLKKGKAGNGRTFEIVFNNGETRGFAAHTKEETEEWMKKLREASTKLIEDNSENTSDHHSAIQAVEQDFEEEVLHECFETSGSSLVNEVHQEWRVALKGGNQQQGLEEVGHFRQYSR